MKKVKYMARFIHLAIELLHPLQKLTPKQVEVTWLEDLDEYFKSIKMVLSEFPTLMPPWRDYPFFVNPSVEAESIGAIIPQQDPQSSVMRPVYFTSRVTTTIEKGYSEAELMMLSLIFAVRKYRSYLLTKPFVIFTSVNLLPWVSSQITMSPRISKWSVELQSYEYTFKVENSVRAQLVGILTYQLHEKVIKVPNVRPLLPPPPKVLSNAYTLFFDGAFRRATRKTGGVLVLVNLDCEVIMKEQVFGHVRMRTKVTSIRKLFSQFEKVWLYHIPRKDNEDADLLAQQAVSNQDKAHVVIAAIALKDPQYAGMESLTPVVNYILEGELPKEFTTGQRRKLIKQASTFLWLEGALYQKGKDLVCRRVPSTCKIPKILKGLHEEACGGHFSHELTLKKVLLAGYVWPSTHTDVQHWCRSCHNCQVNGNKKLLYGPRQADIANGPFEKWRIDAMGPLPRIANGKLYILVAIDYMTRWVEAQSVARVNEKIVSKFVYTRICYRFGTPLEIVSDNGPGFRKGLLTEVCEELKISHRHSTSNYPQSNSLVEKDNGIIAGIIKKMMETNRITIRLALEFADKPYDLPASSNASRITKRLADGCSEDPHCVFTALDCIKLQCGPSEHPSVSRITIRLALELADNPYDLLASSNASQLTIPFVDGCSKGPRCIFSALYYVKLQRGPFEHPSASRITIRLALKLIGKPYDLPTSSNASRMTNRLTDGCSKGPPCIFNALDCVKVQRGPFEHPLASRITIRLALELAGKPYDLPASSNASGLPYGLPMGAQKVRVAFSAL
ncbi:hypothetical protein L7F22_032915 [Adiantum nelumboides]|nr:hypothetical protein [Adiantum nelumboides]